MDYSDDYSYQTIESKYDDMGINKFAQMGVDERGEYYHALYQYFARMLMIVHEVVPTDADEGVYPPLARGEYHALSSVGNTFMALIDGLAGLVAMAEDSTP